jgi:uncharacterized membrane protein
MAVAALVLLFTVIYSLIGVFRHWQFGSSAFDLGIFDQAVWHASRFEAPASTVSGFSNVLGDHFSPMIVVFVPLYWIAPGPETLIVVQALLFAASIVPVFLFLRSRLDSAPSLLFCGAYSLFWGLQRAAAFDVHEIAFAPLLIATAILAVDRRRWALFWATALAIALVKEDLIPLLTFLAIYLIRIGERRRGWTLLAISVVAFVVLVQVVIPALGDTGQYQHKGGFTGVLSRPWRIPLLLVTPPAKLETALMWLAPFAFLSLASPFGWLIAPFVLTRLLSDSPTHWGTRFHYAAPLAPILAMSAGDGLSRIARRVARDVSRRRIVNSAAASCLVLSLFLPGNQPLWDLFDLGHYRPTAVHLAGRRALQLVPADASVVAQSAIVPHLSRRNEIYVLEPEAPDADIVIASMDLNPYPNGSSEAIRALVRERRTRGYSVVFDELGWIVLRRAPQIP